MSGWIDIPSGLQTPLVVTGELTQQGLQETITRLRDCVSAIERSSGYRFTPAGRDARTMLRLSSSTDLRSVIISSRNRYEILDRSTGEKIDTYKNTKMNVLFLCSQEGLEAAIRKEQYTGASQDKLQNTKSIATTPSEQPSPKQIFLDKLSARLKKRDSPAAVPVLKEGRTHQSVARAGFQTLKPSA